MHHLIIQLQKFSAVSLVHMPFFLFYNVSQKWLRFKLNSTINNIVVWCKYFVKQFPRETDFGNYGTSD